MPFGLSLKKLIRRDPVASLRERAAELRASIPAPRLPIDDPAPTYVEHVAQPWQRSAARPAPIRSWR